MIMQLENIIIISSDIKRFQISRNKPKEKHESFYTENRKALLTNKGINKYKNIS